MEKIVINDDGQIYDPTDIKRKISEKEIVDAFSPSFEIYWIENGNKDYCGKTNNPKKWLEENNKRRHRDVVCCDEYEDDHKQKICSCIERMSQFKFELEAE